MISRGPAVALVSARAARAEDEDLPPLLAAFSAAGAQVEIADWDDPRIEWARFDVALLRSTWDYTQRLPEFLAWVRRTATRTRLLNPQPWCAGMPTSTTCTSLRTAGLPVVASTFAEPGADPAAVLAEFLAREACAEFVVKPAVSAGSRDTRRHARTQGRRQWRTCGGCSRHSAACCCSHTCPLSMHMARPRLFLSPDASATRSARRRCCRRARPPRARCSRPSRSRRAPRSLMNCELAGRVLAALPFGVLPYARVDLIRDAGACPVPAGAGAHRAVAVLRARPGSRAAPRRGDARAPCEAARRAASTAFRICDVAHTKSAPKLPVATKLSHSRHGSDARRRRGLRVADTAVAREACAHESDRSQHGHCAFRCCRIRPVPQAEPRCVVRGSAPRVPDCEPPGRRARSGTR